MQKQTEKSPSTLFERYIFLEELIGLKAQTKESVSLEEQIDLLLDCEQSIISQLAEQASSDTHDLERKIRILFSETDILGRSGAPEKPIERLANSILADLNSLSATAVPTPQLISKSA